MRHANRGRIVVMLAISALGALAVAVPATAAAASQPQQHGVMRGYPDGRPAARNRPAIVDVLAGYAWSDGGSYYDYNSTGGSVAVSTVSGFPGIYQVSFGGLSGIGDTTGDVQVTAYDTSDTCAVVGWGPDSTNELVDVACYTPADALDTSSQLFDVTITEPLKTPSGVYDYAWVNPDNKSVSLGGGFGEYNSAHKANRVEHLGTGRYEVVFPGPKSKGQHGTVEVTPYVPDTTYASGAGDCVDAGWTGTRTGVDVDVDCYSGTGARQNREFDVVYASASNVLGLGGAADANTLFSGKGVTATPVESYFSNRRATAVSAQSPAGNYAVLLPGSAGLSGDFGGDVQVGAVSGKDYHCIVDDWGTEPFPNITLECFNSAGHAVSTPYALQWVNLDAS
jgi:hypothetical protein